MSTPTPRGSVVSFAGHMIDGAKRPVPRFPASAEGLIAEAMRRELDKLNPVAGVTALASGGDILFAEYLIERGADVHVLLPLANEAFIQESVRPAGESWVARFHDVLSKVKSYETFGDDYYQGSGTPFQLAALLIDGTAQLIARDRDLDAVTFVLWDAKPGDGLGGAASFVGHAVQQGRRIVAVHPATGDAFVPGAEAIAAAQRHSWSVTPLGSTTMEHRLCAFLFADVKGFGRLREPEMPRFVKSVVKLVEQATAAAKAHCLAMNTWGDGLVVVTKSPAEAGEIALLLIEGGAAEEFRNNGFTFRVGLHCGPAFYIANDPIIDKPNVYGADVSLAARIEPIVEPGQAWASRSFVVMSAATNAAGFEFDDKGLHDLYKTPVKLQLFRVRRARK